MKGLIHPVILVISAMTIVSGLIQLVSPGFVLRFTGAEQTETGRHFFAIIGMFMILFGGLMIHTVYSTASGTAAIFWCALQKLGASLAVFIGIIKGVFALQAGLVAGFDLLSGILFLYYLQYRKQIDSITL